MIIEPLAGYTIAVTADRRREEFGHALQRHGARVAYAPALRIVAPAEDAELLAATRRCLEVPLDVVIATTGIGFQGWLELADARGLAQRLTAAIGGAAVLARGPKARAALRARGLPISWWSESDSSAEVLEHLLAGYDLGGSRIAVQLHGEPVPELVDTLRGKGAEVIEVAVYRWVPPDDIVPLRALVHSVTAHGVDAVAFTSAPAAASLLQTADHEGCGAGVRGALQTDVVAACIGPVTAWPLLREGIVALQPGRARLGDLVREIVEQVPARRGRTAVAAGHALDVRGHAVVVDGVLTSLPATSMALLRELLRRPGHVVARAALLRLLPGAGADGHAVDVAVSRLRAGLGDPRIVHTVIKRGYRLAVER